MKCAVLLRSTRVIHAILVMLAMCAYKPSMLADDTNKENPAISGIQRLFSEIGTCCRCHIQKWRAGTEPLEHVASYTRHRKQGRCRTYVGSTFHEYDANNCPDHADKQVQGLLELCRSAVTYHLPTGEIEIVEADPTAGKRNHVPAGPYAARITQKPIVERAELHRDEQQGLMSVRLIDSSDRVLMVFTVTKPLKEVEIETGTVYLIDKHMLNKAVLCVDTNGVTTAVEVEPQQRFFNVQ